MSELAKSLMKPTANLLATQSQGSLMDDMVVVPPASMNGNSGYYSNNQPTAMRSIDYGSSDGFTGGIGKDTSVNTDWQGNPIAKSNATPGTSMTTGTDVNGAMGDMATSGMYNGTNIYTDGVFDQQKALSAGMSPTQISDMQKGAYAQDQMGTSFSEYASAGAAGLGAVTGIASYFDNKDMNKKRMEAMDTNIAIAKEEQQHRRDFRSGTKSAFA